MVSKLETTLLANLLEVRGSSYKKSSEYGAAKRIVHKFGSWTGRNYPLLSVKQLTKEIVMEYLFQVAHDARWSGQVREYGFADLTAKVLSNATGYPVSIYETTILQPYAMVCPVCNVLAEFVNDKTLYGRDFGGRMFYHCPQCDSRVGTYEGTPIPLGSLAGPLTVELRRRCHQAFDTLWKHGMMSRDEAYLWLANAMGLPLYAAHIGKFNNEQCIKLLRLLREEHAAAAAAR